MIIPTITLLCTLGPLLLFLLAGTLVLAYKLEPQLVTTERLKELELLRLLYSQLSEEEGDRYSQKSEYFRSEISRLSRGR